MLELHLAGCEERPAWQQVPESERSSLLDMALCAFFAAQPGDAAAKRALWEALGYLMAGMKGVSSRRCRLAAALCVCAA